MNHDQVREVMAYMGQLWPKADLDDADKEAWIRTLARLQHPDVARHALTRLKDTTDFNGPKRGQFLEQLGRQTSGKPRSQDPARLDYPGFVLCSDGERKGWFVPLCYAQDIPPENVVMQHLQQLAQDHEAIYGGTWQMVREPGRLIAVAEMMAWRHRLVGTIPISDRPKPVKPEKPKRNKPAEVGGSLRAALNDFFAGQTPRFEPLPESQPPPPSDEEAGSYEPPAYALEEEPF